MVMKEPIQQWLVEAIEATNWLKLMTKVVEHGFLGDGVFQVIHTQKGIETHQKCTRQKDQCLLISWREFAEGT